MVRIQFLVENKTESELYDAEHGLSVLVTTPEGKYLFDTGASPDLMLRNAEAMGASLSDVKGVIISHGHFDHTGGLPAFAVRNTKAPVYLHQEAFRETWATRDGTLEGPLEDKPCSILWTENEKEMLAPRLVFTNEPVWISRDMVVSGTIPENYTDGQATEPFYQKNQDGALIMDDMVHEQFFAVRNRDEEGNPTGIVLFSGCSHKGVMPAIRYAADLFPGERVSVFLAGMHLYHAAPAMVDRVLDEILAEGVKTVLPVHCTGIEAICRFHQRLGAACPIATCGKTYEF